MNLKKPLSDLEHLVFDFLWKAGPSSFEQVRDGLAARHPMKDATVRTILGRIEQKGYATHRVEGRTFIYEGAEPRQNLAVRAIRQIIDRFCGGSVEELLVGMVRHNVIDAADLREITKTLHSEPKTKHAASKNAPAHKAGTGK
jgi:BlaI family transcriptional regulator, penicillinase repressor